MNTNEMNTNKQHKEALELVESMGLFFEKSGYLPSAGRVYALLMIWEKSELHFDEIQSILQLSKGATSKAINALLGMKRIEEFTRTGIRKKFFRVKVKPGQASTERFIEYLKAMQQMLIRIETHKETYDIDTMRFTEEINFFDKLIEMFRGVLNGKE